MTECDATCETMAKKKEATVPRGTVLGYCLTMNVQVWITNASSSAENQNSASGEAVKKAILMRNLKRSERFGH